MSILQQTIHDVQIQQARPASPEQYISESSSTVQEQPSKVSKKRKRSGELVPVLGSTGRNGLLGLLESIYGAINDIVRASKVSNTSIEDQMEASFSAECMKAVIRTSGDESAKILGSWLTLCEIALKMDASSTPPNARKWLSPFLTIWETHAIGNGDIYLFSQSCTRPLLSLLRALKNGGDDLCYSLVRSEWTAELERFIARHIIIPVQTASEESGGLDFGSVLGEGTLSQHPDYVSIVFNIAIRSLQNNGSRKWRVQDEKWLQNTFATLKDSISSMSINERGKAIYRMLESVIRFKLSLGLSVLKSITLEYALQDGDVDWDMLAMVMRIDINTFLIPNDEDRLLEGVLTRVTRACLDEKKLKQISKQVVSDILIPLLRGFSKVRDLSGFIRHWFAQVVELEQLRKESQLEPVDFSVWEAESLQDELSRLLETSLTVQQIGELLDWLSSEVSRNGNAVALILDAIASSIHQEEVADHVGLRLYHIMFDGESFEKLSDTYKWRAWRIISKTLYWAPAATIPHLEDLWQKKAKPFGELTTIIGKSKLKLNNRDSADLESVEVFRCTCALWNFMKKGSQTEEELRPLIRNLVENTRKRISKSTDSVREDQTIFSTQPSTFSLGNLWVVWSFSRCLFLVYPKVLEYNLPNILDIVGVN